MRTSRILLIISLILFSGCYSQRINELQARVRQLEEENYALHYEQQYEHLLQYGPSIVLEHIHFTSKGSRLLPSSFTQLDDLARELAARHDVLVRITCHTDDLGSSRYNFRLSVKRLHTMRDYLVERGVRREQIITIGLGEAWPRSAINTWDGRNDNRRVEVQFAQF